MATDPAGALPVRVSVDSRFATQLVPHVEGVLGWQVTSGDELPAALALLGVGGSPVAGVPTVLLVRDEDPPHRVARHAVGAAAVVRWPDERDQLRQVAAALLEREAVPPASMTVRFGGASGGVGTTTVTLALGGLAAWRGRPTLVVVTGDVPVPDVPVVDPAALSAHRTWEAAAEVAGVAGLRVLATAPGIRAPACVPDGTLVLRDDGVTGDVDVLVCARDRAGLAAVDTTVAGVVIVAERGPISPPAWDRAAAGRARQVRVAWSARVGRAGLVQRVPASLPGRWLANLSPLSRALAS